MALDINMCSSAVFAVVGAGAYSEDSASTCGTGSLKAYLHGTKTQLSKDKNQSEIFGRI